MSDNSLDWISNYSEFTSKLKHNFRLHDPEGDVENELEALWMKDNQWMVKYLVDLITLQPESPGEILLSNTNYTKDFQIRSRMKFPRLENHLPSLVCAN